MTTATVRFLWNSMAPPDDLEAVLVPRRDTEVREGDNWRPARQSLADIFDLDGWTWQSPVMVLANARPGGYHRFEVDGASR